MTSLVPRDQQWATRQGDQASAFDQIGDRYDEAFPHKDGQVYVAELLLDRLPTGARVLDVGCGTGLPVTRRLADQGCQVTGIDFSPVMIKIASRNVPSATFLCRDITTLDQDFGVFDAVVAFFSLLMLPRPVIVSVLPVLRQLIAPGGCLALGMVEADIDDVPIPFLGHPVRVSGWPIGQLHKVLVGAGFDIAAESIRSYTPVVPDMPPEVQVYMIATPNTNVRL